MSTIRDVARIAGVSTATVSRVINTPEKVGPGNRKRVYRAMEICRYKYNALARGFATKRSNILGLIVPTITNPIFAESTRGAQDFANEKGYQVILGNSDYQYEKEAKLIEVLRERRVEGLIITTTNLKGEALKTLLDDEFPFLISRGFGSFMVKDYKPYVGRNPKTGVKIKVPSKKLPFFKVGKGLRDTINND